MFANTMRTILLVFALLLVPPAFAMVSDPAGFAESALESSASDCDRDNDCMKAVAVRMAQQQHRSEDRFGEWVFVVGLICGAVWFFGRR